MVCYRAVYESTISSNDSAHHLLCLPRASYGVLLPTSLRYLYSQRWEKNLKICFEVCRWKRRAQVLRALHGTGSHPDSLRMYCAGAGYNITHILPCLCSKDRSRTNRGPWETMNSTFPADALVHPPVSAGRTCNGAGACGFGPLENPQRSQTMARP